jgi:creatinine amidohydrolase
LQETAEEMSRNGCKKIIIENGHGGNNELVPYFARIQLAKRRDYVVYTHAGQMRKEPAGRPPVTSKLDGHAAESETSRVMVSRPDLVHLERAGAESGENLARQDLPEGVTTPISWYARYPNHYAGNAAAANRALGEFDMKAAAARLVNVIRAVKADNVSLRLQNEFFDRADRPLETRP